jgi:hypothetical protein
MRWPLAALVLALVLALLACGKHGPSPECEAYVACAEAVDATVTHTVEGEFGSNGTCWSTNSLTADACTSTCVVQLGDLRADAGSAVAECGP